MDELTILVYCCGVAPLSSLWPPPPPLPKLKVQYTVYRQCVSWGGGVELCCRPYSAGIFLLSISDQIHNLPNSVADPGCLSRIPDPDFYPSRIPDPKTATKRGWKKICCHTFFCIHKFHKIEIYFNFEVPVLKKKIWANFQRIMELFTQKIVKVLKNMGLGSEIRDPKKNLFRIPDPGVKKAPDPGSGSATLLPNCFTKQNDQWKDDIKGFVSLIKFLHPSSNLSVLNIILFLYSVIVELTYQCYVIYALRIHAFVFYLFIYLFIYLFYACRPLCATMWRIGRATRATPSSGSFPTFSFRRSRRSTTGCAPPR